MDCLTEDSSFGLKIAYLCLKRVQEWTGSIVLHAVVDFMFPHEKASLRTVHPEVVGALQVIFDKTQYSCIYLRPVVVLRWACDKDLDYCRCQGL